MVPFMTRNRGVAQLVERYVRDVEVARSNRVTPTYKQRLSARVAFVRWENRSGDAAALAMVTECAL